MIKLAFAAVALTAVGTTLYIARDTGSSEPTPPPVASVVERVATNPPEARAQHAPPAPSLAPAQEAPALPHKAIQSREPEEFAVVETAVFDRLKSTGPAKGAADAPITIVMFTDLQCPYCEKVHGTLDQLFEEYGGKLRLVIKQLPVHKTARLAAEASLAAEAQGKFWELQDKMLAASEDLSRDKLVEMGRAAGLDAGRFAQALDARTYAGGVDEDMKRAADLEITGTPSLVINGRRVIGNRPIEDLRALLDELLAKRS
ncbi:MAG: thioredoxin domain-containing protein [Kofleriaceae bacterium]